MLFPTNSRYQTVETNKLVRPDGSEVVYLKRRFVPQPERLVLLQEHAVVEGDPDDVLLVGPLLETHPRFPNRTNVQVVRVDGPGLVTARVWERGVGETQASGTSAVAVAAATHGDGEVVVRFPGGDLRVRLDGGRAWLTGPAHRLE